MNISFGHTVTIKYLGATDCRGSRIKASWEGWPSDDSKVVSRTIGRDYSTDDYTEWAANAFLEWLNGGDWSLHTIKSVAKGNLGGGKDVLIITTES